MELLHDTQLKIFGTLDDFFLDFLNVKHFFALLHIYFKRSFWYKSIGLFGISKSIILFAFFKETNCRICHFWENTIRPVFKSVQFSNSLIFYLIRHHSDQKNECYGELSQKKTIEVSPWTWPVYPVPTSLLTNGVSTNVWKQCVVPGKDGLISGGILIFIKWPFC